MGIDQNILRTGQHYETGGNEQAEISPSAFGFGLYRDAEFKILCLNSGPLHIIIIV